MNTNIAFIGGGNMTAALVMGLLNAGYSAECITVSNRSANKLIYFAKLGVQTTQSNHEAVQKAEAIIFAVKPKQLKAVCNELATVIGERQPLLISVAISVSMAMMTRWLAGDYAVVRAMPNTPAMVSAGATGLYANAAVSAKQRDLAESIFRSTGIVAWVQAEDVIRNVIAVSGSGPAYYFLLMEAMQAAAEEMGLEAGVAKTLTQQTAFGAAKLALESTQEFSQLRSQVTSPGGTTEQAINYFLQSDFKNIVAKAMQAAAARSLELRQELEAQD
ncbi:MAG: pyrroline-5-carboxylate reductase [Gammaproteobacteria bacterium]|nr:pyrroline-5-carboxylate reductase [Gammaproteobacteria bacterium]